MRSMARGAGGSAAAFVLVFALTALPVAGCHAPRCLFRITNSAGIVDLFCCKADIRRASFFLSGISLVVGLSPNLATFLCRVVFVR